jgi:nitrite reductase/ring-hydroxylating ferredoxin subunit
MKRTDRLVSITRRDFCALAGCLGLAAACDGTATRIAPDAAPPDASGPTASCAGAAAWDVGLASSFAIGAPVLFADQDFYVVRDSGGLYAVSSRCTHQGGQNNVWQGHFICPLHGSEFTFDGAVLSGPATSPLAHYAMCAIANGRVAVVTTEMVATTTRLKA